MSTIPFDEITPGATARFVVIDRVQYLVVRDVLMFVCDLTPKRANEKWERLPEDIKNELAEHTAQHRFPGPGNPTPVCVMTFPGILKLIMRVSGEKAGQYRASMVKILQRYYAGDGSLVDEIEANAASNAPIAQLARASLAQEVKELDIETVEDRKRKRVREDAELIAMEVDTHLKRLASVRQFTDTMSLISPHWTDDVRLRMRTEDHLKNILFHHGGQTAIANGDPVEPTPASITVCDVAKAEFGARLTHGQQSSIGTIMKNKYKKLYETDPVKCKRFVDNEERWVNSYTERDRGMMIDAIKTVLKR